MSETKFSSYIYDRCIYDHCFPNGEDYYIHLITDVLKTNPSMIHNIVISCSLLLHVSHVSGLFEHQAGKFDWKQNYVGEVSHMGYYSNSQNSWWA